MSRRNARERHEPDRDRSRRADQIAYAAPTSRPTLQSPILRALACAAILALAVLTFASSANADGDPASDVLAAQPLFLPWDANVPAPQQAQLQGILTSARQHRFEIRVAVIASAADLGSVAALWRDPQQYAEFLGEELSLVYKGPLLVVMPNGFGLHGFTVPAGTVSSALADIRAPTDGSQLAQVTIAAIDRLASAAGHPLPSIGASALTASGNHHGSSIGTVGWAVLLIGCLLIAAAWTASLRATPLRAPSERSSPA